MSPETIAGRYEVEREVGRGGMGSVWLCRDVVLSRVVAAKQVGLMPGEATPDLARAMREARSSAPLNHPNVVSVYDVIEEGDHIWLVMEYVPGRTLAQIMADGRLAPGRAAGLGAQVADGLAAAHARGTVHRDVKPSNILVTDDDHAKISDFGISRTTGDAVLTHSGLVSGTPAYFSPQLARGLEPTPADDVWALGATLYAAVEGRPPFPEQANHLAMLTEITSGEVRAAEDPGALAGPLQRMLDPDPDARWSMSEVAQALHRIHRDHDDSGTRASVPVAAATSVLPESAPDPTPTPQEAYVAPAPVPSGPDSQDSQGSRRALLVGLAVLLLVAALGGGYLLLNDGNGSDTAGGPTAGSSGTTSADRSPDTSTRTSTGTSSSLSQSDETSSAPSPAPASGSRTAFVEDYYGVLPDDTEAGWSMLSRDYQSRTSYGDYAGFWDTIDEVSVDVAPAPGGAVDATITYTTDGSSQTETRRIELARDGDGYLISGDQVVG
ncbi:serine/threonine protein kinase [Nocardioides ginsengisegetis]|uniref:non-specific serine/threonine protein kinase n=1 Tax=Nocardioides ginsengisegetis TaxID=661491 RepID=A0A7W3J1E0_9ACTN|nr:serine/threonine-protein kinase [Nocardioides ginsengisegetis]MBA8804513.1 serine/threonine protein kinase [Nocardioides ginsengisegetis]